MALKAYLEQVNEPKEASVEGRRHPRHSLKLHTSGVSDGGAPANVTIHNLSAAGLLIETELELVPGDRLAIGLPEVGPVGAEIVWVSERLYGCAFEQALGEAALAATRLQSEPAALSPVQSEPRGAGQAFGGKLSGATQFGPQLNRLRRERSLTLEQVANALGVSKPTVWAWEKGKAKPIPERLEGIAEVLGVSAADLIQEPPKGSCQTLLAECRLRIASEYGIEPDHVRIMIEV